MQGESAVPVHQSRDFDHVVVEQPGRVRTRADGRVELEFINPRPDEIQVLITARRR